MGKDRIRKTEGVREDACMSEDLINGRIKKECFTAESLYTWMHCNNAQLMLCTTPSTPEPNLAKTCSNSAPFKCLEPTTHKQPLFHKTRTIATRDTYVTIHHTIPPHSCIPHARVSISSPEQFNMPHSNPQGI